MFAALFFATVQQAALVDEWISRAERIALGRVERVLQFDTAASNAVGGPVRIAVVRVERQLVGPEGEGVLYVVDTFPRSAPETGERALFFVSRWEGQHLESKVRRRIDRDLGGLPAWQPLSTWSWMQEEPEVRLPHWLVEERWRAGESLLEEAVLTSIEAGLSRCLPRIHAECVVFGGPGWNLRLGPDRAIMEGAQSSGILPAERWDALLDLVERTRFLELPEHVGRSLGPDETCIVIEFRTRHGTHSVRIWGGAPEAPEAVPAWTRAREVWNALPGDRRPM